MMAKKTKQHKFKIPKRPEMDRSALPKRAPSEVKKRYFDTYKGSDEDRFHFAPTPEDFKILTDYFAGHKLPFNVDKIWVDRLMEREQNGKLLDHLLAFEAKMTHKVDPEKRIDYLNDLAIGWNIAAKQGQGKKIKVAKDLPLKCLTPKEIKTVVKRKKIYFFDDLREIESVNEIKDGIQLLVRYQHDIKLIDLLEHLKQSKK